MGCEVDSVLVADVANVGEVGGLAFVDPIVPILEIIGYTYTRVYCTDCRLQGGSLTKPPYWE